MIDCSGMASGENLTLDPRTGNSGPSPRRTQLTGSEVSGHSCDLDPAAELGVAAQRVEAGTRMIRLAIIIALPSLALAQALPQPKPIGPGGSCPHGHTSSGSFCVPRQGAQDAIPLPPNGTCPWGYTRSGSYCLRSGSQR